MNSKKEKRFGNPLRILPVAALLLGGFFGGIMFHKYYPFEKIRNSTKISSIPPPAPQFVGNTPSGTVVLNTRWFVPAVDKERFDTEKDSEYRIIPHPLNLDKTALVLIDVCESHPNDGWLKRANKNIKEKMVPLLELARKHKMVIVHASHGSEIAKDCRPLPGEFVVDSGNSVNDTTELVEYLKSRDITTLLYAGYASNWCLLNRPTGIIRMRQLGGNIILIRDCTIAFETPESLKEEWANRIAINLVECQWGPTTTLEDLRAALERG